MKKILEKSLVSRLNSEMKGGEKMKKVSRFLMLAVAAIMLMAGSAMAYPFLEVTGLANPDYASFVDNLDGTTTLDVKYLFRVDVADSGAEMKGLNLELEKSVFYSVSSFVVSSPIDWTVSEVTSSVGNIYEISTAGLTGTTLGQGEKLVLSANVTLFTDALTNASYWGEGQVWGQSFTAFDTLNGAEGGSTAPVPEPATLILLGSGLAGLALYGRRKKTI